MGSLPKQEQISANTVFDFDEAVTALDDERVLSVLDKEEGEARRRGSADFSPPGDS